MGLSYPFGILGGMTKRDIDQRLLAISNAQHGWFSAAHAEAAGADDGVITRRRREGSWVRRHPGVYKMAAYPDSYFGDLWAAHLAAGWDSYVSHEAAAHVQKVAGFARATVVLTIPHPGHARVDGAVVHQLTDTQLREFNVIEGLRVTTIPWTFVDLAATTSKARLRFALDDVIAARRTDVQEIGRCLALVARPGKPGVLMLAGLLDRHRSGPVPPTSVLERTLFGGMRKRGIRSFRLQHPHPGRMPGPARVDGCDVQAKLIVEADGRRWHTRIADLKRDHDRDAEAARAGYETIRCLHEDVVADLEATIAMIREIRDARLALFAAAGRLSRQ